jgi:hypothetical protein
MDEANWLACADPMPMLDFLRRSTPPARRRGDHRWLGAFYLPDSDCYLPDLGRKGCLFVCACLYRSPSKQDVEECLLFQEYEKYCDGLAPWAAVEDAYWNWIKREAERIAEEDRKNNSVTSVHWMMPSEYFADPALITQAAERAVGGKNADGFAVERRLQCGFIRDIFGNPFRPLPPRPEAIAPLAEQIYAGAWDMMPILGEWLQEHGYWSEGEHCLDPNIHHVKGCWVVDWVTGR